MRKKKVKQFNIFIPEIIFFLYTSARKLKLYLCRHIYNIIDSLIHTSLFLFYAHDFFFSCVPRNANFNIYILSAWVFIVYKMFLGIFFSAPEFSFVCLYIPFVHFYVHYVYRFFIFVSFRFHI